MHRAGFSGLLLIATALSALAVLLQPVAAQTAMGFALHEHPRGHHQPEDLAGKGVDLVERRKAAGGVLSRSMRIRRRVFLFHVFSLLPGTDLKAEISPPDFSPEARRSG
jgi:hypothetical protein